MIVLRCPAFSAGVLPVIAERTREVTFSID